MPKNPMAEPPGFANPQLKSNFFESGNVRQLIIRIGDYQINVDDGFSREALNRR
jgi:hypothetical protein